MTIPSYQNLMLPVLLVAAEGVTTVPLAAKSIADKLQMSDEDREKILPSGTRVLNSRVYWAKLYLTKAGLITVPSRGKFIASDSGKALLATNPTQINNEMLLKYPSFAEFYKGLYAKQVDIASETLPSQSPQVNNITPEEQMDAAYVSFTTALKDDLIKRVLDNFPTFFEKLIVELLVAMGYGGSYANAAMQLGKSGDGGVDGVINQDRLGLDRVYIQAKRYTGGTVGRPEVQKIRW